MNKILLALSLLLSIFVSSQSSADPSSVARHKKHKKVPHLVIRPGIALDLIARNPLLLMQNIHVISTPYGYFVKNNTGLPLYIYGATTQGSTKLIILKPSKQWQVLVQSTATHHFAFCPAPYLPLDRSGRDFSYKSNGWVCYY